MQIYATMQILKEGGEETAQLHQDIQNDDEKQIYFYEINRSELLQEMRDQTLKVKEQNDKQMDRLKEESERILVEHTEIKTVVEKKQKKIMESRDKFKKLFDFFELIKQEKYDHKDGDPELPIDFEEYMSSEDACHEYYGKQLTVSFEGFIL